MPDGWKFSKGTGSPLCGYAFASNGIPLRGGKMALVRVQQQKAERQTPEAQAFNDAPVDVANKRAGSDSKSFVFDASQARTVNELARQKFKKKLLEDILVDLTICEIEGWCKKEYIKELRMLLNDIKVGVSVLEIPMPTRKLKSPKTTPQNLGSTNQCDLFD